jgi:hypothetical protein
MKMDSATMKKYRELSNEDKDRLHSLVTYLCEGEPYSAYEETLYAYLNGIADWKEDYNKFKS